MDGSISNSTIRCRSARRCANTARCRRGRRRRTSSWPTSCASGDFVFNNDTATAEIYTVPEERRPRLAYYRNNAIHLFVADGLVALALIGASKRGLVSVEELRQRTLQLSRLLKLEFSY